MLSQIKVYGLDWDEIIVEGYDEMLKEITMVFNCDISTLQKSQKVIKYVVGRTSWGYLNFPPNVAIRLSFDIRGQGVIISKSDFFKRNLLEIFNCIGIKNSVFIDFLR